MLKIETYCPPIRKLALVHLCLTLLGVLSLKAEAAPLFHEGRPELPAEVKEIVLPDFSALIKTLTPAVVNIAVEAAKGSEKEDEQQQQLPPFLRRDPSLPVRSAGSGVVVSADGYIITNNHVVANATKIIVRFGADKTEWAAKLIGADPKSDVALIKIDGKSLPFAFLGDSDAIEVGQWVVAIGNQFQLGQSVTAGIVSATARRVVTGSPYDAFIQTDASINPGSSGGPLFNQFGQVVGINTAIFTPGRAQLGGAGFNIGIGFAIPINLVKSIAKQLKENKKVTRGLLGVMIQNIDADMAQALGLSKPEGALVSDLKERSPAERAGIRKKDIIISFNGLPVRDHDELPLMVASTQVGKEVVIKVLRSGKELALNARIIELKDEEKVTQVAERADLLGLRVMEVSPLVSQEYKQPTKIGVLVDSVDNGSPAERAGLAKGDIIEELNGVTITKLSDYQAARDILPKNSPVLVLARRAEGTRFYTLKVSK